MGFAAVFDGRDDGGGKKGRWEMEGFNIVERARAFKSKSKIICDAVWAGMTENINSRIIF